MELLCQRKPDKQSVEPRVYSFFTWLLGKQNKAWNICKVSPILVLYFCLAP